MSDPTDFTADADLDFSVVQHPRRVEAEEVDRASLRRSGRVADPTAGEPPRRKTLLSALRQRLRRLREDDPDIYPLW